MLPVAVLPVAGLLLGIGARQLRLDAGPRLRAHEELGRRDLRQHGRSSSPSAWRSGFTENDGVSAVAATIGYAVMLATMGVMAGRLGPGARSPSWASSPCRPASSAASWSAALAAAMFNRFYRIALPPYLGFFAGKRFVPIITALARHRAGRRSCRWSGRRSRAASTSSRTGRRSAIRALAATVYGFVERLLMPVRPAPHLERPVLLRDRQLHRRHRQGGARRHPALLRRRPDRRHPGRRLPLQDVRPAGGGHRHLARAPGRRTRWRSAAS